MTLQAQVRMADGWIVAVGEFPSGSPDPGTLSVVDLTAEQEAVVTSETPGQRVLGSDGTVTIIPPSETPQQLRRFAAAEDAERLALVAERAAEDPAFAALAELALKGD